MKSIPSLIILVFYLLIKERNSFIVFHGFPFQFIAPFFSSINNGFVFMVYHQYKKIPHSWIGYCSTLIEKYFLRSSSSLLVVGVSPWVVESLLTNFQPRNKVKTLTIPINIKQKRKESKIKEFKDKKYLIYGARLVREKGQLRLLEDLYSMNIKKPFINKIIFCGSGPLINEINSFAKTKLSNFEIIIMENLDKEKYLNLVKQSSGFLFPSYREAFSLSLLESIFVCENIFIWEKYLYKYYSECSYEKKNLKNFLLNGNLKKLNNRKEAIKKLKSKYLKSGNFLQMIN